MNPRPLSTRTFFLLILFFGIAAYSNTLHAPFYFDDYPSILNNSSILNPWDWIGLLDKAPTRFLVFFSFAINYKIGGASPFGYHVVNLIIHLLNGILVFGIALLLSTPHELQGKTLPPAQKNLIAFASAIIFVCHPVQTQAVTYIVQRMTSMASFFYLATILLYLHFRISKVRAFYLLGLFTALLSMLSKEIAFTLPVTLLLCEILFFNQNAKSIPSLVKRLLPFVLVSLLIPGMYFLNHEQLVRHGGQMGLVPTGAKNLSRSMYFITQLDVIRTYLRLLVFPIRQTFDYDFPLSTGFFSPATFGSFMLLVAILATGYRLIRKQPLAVFGILFFFLTLSIESTIIPLPDLIFEHRLYLPMAGFAFLTASFLAKFLKSPRLFTIISIALALILGTLTYQRNTVWTNEIVFWKDQIKKAPFKGRGYFQLGMAYNKIHQYPLAADSFLEALRWTPEDKKNDIEFNNVGAAYDHSGQTTKAEHWFRKGLESHPKSGTLHTNLAVLEARKGNSEDAILLLKKSIALEPGTAIAYYELAHIYSLRNEYSKAIPLLEKAIDLDPFLSPAHELLERMYEQQANQAKNLSTRQASEGNSPKDTISRDRITGSKKESATPSAIVALEEALRISPADPSLHVQLGELYRKSGQEDSAVKSFQKAIKVAPLRKEGYEALALFYNGQGDKQKALAVLMEYLKLKKKHGSLSRN